MGQKRFGFPTPLFHLIKKSQPLKVAQNRKMRNPNFIRRVEISTRPSFLKDIEQDQNVKHNQGN